MDVEMWGLIKQIGKLLQWWWRKLLNKMEFLVNTLRWWGADFLILLQNTLFMRGGRHAEFWVSSRNGDPHLAEQNNRKARMQMLDINDSQGGRPTLSHNWVPSWWKSFYNIFQFIYLTGTVSHECQLWSRQQTTLKLSESEETWKIEELDRHVSCWSGSLDGVCWDQVRIECHSLNTLRVTNHEYC